jgi:hypothetical protein
MMKKISTLVISSLGLVALASGCAVDAVESEELLGTEEQEAVVCSNDQATNALIAALAVNMAKEVGSWDTRPYLSSDGYKLSLTSAAFTKCNSRGAPGCPVTSSLLLLQTGGSGLQYGGVQLTDPNVFRSRLMSYHGDQVNCYADTVRNGDSQSQNCPAESHELTLYSTVSQSTACVGGKDFWFKAKYVAPHPMAGQPLSGTDAAQLRNALKWAGGNQNPWLAFEVDPNVVGDVKIDPIEGSTSNGTSSTGAADVALNPVWATNPAPGWWKCDNINDMSKLNMPCTCNGQQRTWKTAVLSGYLSCKL